jgi:hypothetical protein
VTTATATILCRAGLRRDVDDLLAMMGLPWVVDGAQGSHAQASR